MPTVIAEHWPPHGLRLRTPRLELRPDDDPGLGELVEAARAGVHPADQMPFAVPWTDAAPEHLGGGMLRYFWSERAAVAPERWSLNFLTRLDGRVIGTQGLMGVDFAVTREVSTGSWLGGRYQKQGFGTEMRAAVLGLAFDHLGARLARSGAFVDNARSLALSRRLGYVDDGTETLARRGCPATQRRLLLTEADYRAHRPEWRVEVTGLEPCLPMLGAV
ncbi:GNAT family protein [Pseudonocardia eucalypti]|uniref:GNAT family protein n=1 Tax=Pseudonocardia eucalypti TaxID=648755 RepID=A0ABP9QYS2_9PSEU